MKHIGPMAQDFYSAFHVGESDTTISTLDPDGVALASIQELAKRNAALEAEVAELKAACRADDSTWTQIRRIITERNMKKLLLVLLLAANAIAIPQIVNYQGQLTSPTGVPLDTTVAITFNIWPTPAGGVSAWTEAHPAVVVTNGLFNVQLGSITALPDLFGVNRWLGITVGNNTEMTPREQLVSVVHAYRVGTVDGARAERSRKCEYCWQSQHWQWK